MKNSQPNKQNKVNLEGGTVLNREREYSPAPSKAFWKKIFMILPKVS